VEQKNADVTVIGAGPAGVAAAVQCARLGMSVFLLDESGQAGGLVVCANCVENYPCVPPVSGKSFAALLREHLQRFGLSVERTRAVEIVPESDAFFVRAEDGMFLSRVVVTAVGTKHKPLLIEGAEHVFYSPLDVEKGAVRSAAIIGGGEAALDYALSLAANGVSSIISVRGDALRARGRLVDAVRQNEKIRILLNANPEKIIPRKEGGAAVCFCGGTTAPVSVDCVLAAIGRTSRAPELLKGLDLEPSQTVSTALPGLFVVGDARSGVLGQVGTAVGDGLFAAMQAALHIEGKKRQ
jgi:thioredoxin reductase (NADPH)